MNKYELIKYPDKENEFDNCKVIVETEAIEIDCLIEAFNQFIIACGYSDKCRVVRNDK
jgi:hypothetical protein